MNNNEISILCVTENTCLRRDLLAQHGQSFLINYFGKKYLFDVGDFSQVIKYNLKSFGVEFKDIESVIISHRHGDHIGGLVGLEHDLGDRKVYLPDDLGKKHLKENNSKYRFSQRLRDEQDINIALSEKEIETIKSDYGDIEVLNEGRELEKGLFVTSLVGDKIREQAMVIDVIDKGYVLVLGCTHPKLEEMIRAAEEMVGHNRLYGIVGGLHFKDMNNEELDKEFEMLEKLNFEFLVPSHCTGIEAMRKMKERYGDKVVLSSTGSLGVGNEIVVVPELEFRFV